MLRVLNETSHRSPPVQTAVSSIGLSDIASAETQAIVQAWKKWRGWHGMPNTTAMDETDLGGHLDNASLARVVDGGRDYEFEYIGAAHVRAYGANHQGSRVSDICRLSPRFGKQLKASYDLVRISGHPHAFQGAVGADNSDARFVWFETAYLPLGDHGQVDCILNAAVYHLRGDTA